MELFGEGRGLERRSVPKSGSEQNPSWVESPAEDWVSIWLPSTRTTTLPSFCGKFRQKGGRNLGLGSQLRVISGE